MPKEIFAEAMKSGALYGSDNGLLDARRARLIDLIEHAGTKTLKYLYDSGGCWEHTIIIEHLFEPVAGVVYPRLIEATGRCPPDGTWQAHPIPSGCPANDVAYPGAPFRSALG
jgi:hypothetical protein